MPYVTPEQIERAKQMDLLTYLQYYEPNELVHFSGNVYTTRTHDSLKISNGKWCWWSRGIHSDIIDYCIRTGRLYESRDYHNAVLVGFDRQGTPQYATLRGTTNRWYMGEANGSNKHFSFSIPASKQCCKLHLFESAIDLLSYGTLKLLSGRDWHLENCLSLAGIYRPKKNIEESTPPAALMQYLKDFPYIEDIVLHLDKDIPGRLAAIENCIKNTAAPGARIS